MKIIDLDYNENAGYFNSGNDDGWGDYYISELMVQTNICTLEIELDAIHDHIKENDIMEIVNNSKNETELINKLKSSFELENLIIKIFFENLNEN